MYIKCTKFWDYKVSSFKFYSLSCMYTCPFLYFHTVDHCWAVSYNFDRFDKWYCLHFPFRWAYDVCYSKRSAKQTMLALYLMTATMIEDYGDDAPILLPNTNTNTFRLALPFLLKVFWLKNFFFGVYVFFFPLLF